MGAAAGQHDAGVGGQLLLHLGDPVQVAHGVLGHDVGPALHVLEHRVGIDAQGASQLVTAELHELGVRAVVVGPHREPEQLVPLRAPGRGTSPRSG